MRVIRDTQRSWLPISCFMSLFFPDTEPRIRISSRLIFNRISIYFVSFGDIVAGSSSSNSWCKMVWKETWEWTGKITYWRNWSEACLVSCQDDINIIGLTLEVKIGRSRLYECQAKYLKWRNAQFHFVTRGFENEKPLHLQPCFYGFNCVNLCESNNRRHNRAVTLFISLNYATGPIISSHQEAFAWQRFFLKMKVRWPSTWLVMHVCKVWRNLDAE